jgi:hypothetical protein
MQKDLDCKHICILKIQSQCESRYYSTTDLLSSLNVCNRDEQY